jgi:hypothetical protein
MMPGALTSTRHALGRLDRALAVDRVAEAVDDAAEQALADRHVDDRLGAADGVAFLDRGVRAEDHDADIVGLEVERHALDAAVELDHLAGLDVVEAVDAGDAVADRQHGADLADLGLGAEARDLVADDLGNFSGADVHFQPFIACARLFNLVRIEPSIIWRADLDDEPAQDGGIDAEIDRDVAAHAGLRFWP